MRVMPARKLIEGDMPADHFALPEPQTADQISQGNPLPLPAIRPKVPAVHRITNYQELLRPAGARFSAHHRRCGPAHGVKSWHLAEDQGQLIAHAGLELNRRPLRHQ